MRGVARVLAIATLLVGAGTACTADIQQLAGSVAATPNPTPAPGPVASRLILTPAAGATNISPADPVTAVLVGGALDSVTLTAAQTPVAGAFDQTRSSWHSTKPLRFSTKYTMTASGTGADGLHHELARTFTTVKPQRLTGVSLRASDYYPLDGGTFGVGQPIVVRFDLPVSDKAAAQRSMSVITDPPVYGAWRWMDRRELHWRPQEYWPAGTKVTVRADIFGIRLGSGLYGRSNRSASFTIGHSHVAIADSDTHHMKVYVDGQLVKTINGRDVSAGIPISMGKGGGEIGASGQFVNFTTTSGPHVILIKSEQYRMTSASFGITDPTSPNFYDMLIKKTLRISATGEFVHLADWNIPAHGRYNTSHGCINVAPAYIYWFWDTFGPGDVVDVRNTDRPLGLRNGLGDWMLPFEQWQAGGAW